MFQCSNPNCTSLLIQGAQPQTPGAKLIQIIKSIIELEDKYINFRQTVALDYFRSTIVPLHIDIIYKDQDLCTIKEALTFILFEYFHESSKKIHSYHKPTVLVGLVSRMTQYHDL